MRVTIDKNPKGTRTPAAEGGMLLLLLLLVVVSSRDPSKYKAHFHRELSSLLDRILLPAPKMIQKKRLASVFIVLLLKGTQKNVFRSMG